MSLVIYNSESRKKETFVPLKSGEVKMYLCGPTVYGFLHVGNFRGPVFFNLVRNWLEQLGYHVTFVYNYTDVDDRIIQKANDEKVEASVISERYIAEFEKDFARLKLRKHDHNPRVTEFMKPIEDMVQSLVEQKKAYVVDGEVLYSVRSFKDYGKLSGRNIDELQSGARVEVDDKKQDPLDFALWKPAKPGEPGWKSVWGLGRPGWHIECSAMAKSILGDQIDIHGGGMDLMFPHHENEIAQSEGCTGKQFVKYWMHNNMFNFSGQKMSKSLGNVWYGRDFMDEYNPEIYKFIVLSVHYRSLSDFGPVTIDHAIQGLARIYSSLALAESYLKDSEFTPQVDAAFEQVTQAAWKKLTDSLNDDFNTAEAMASIFEVVRAYNGLVKRGLKVNQAIVNRSHQLQSFILKIGKMMSLFQEPATEFLISLDDMLLKKMNVQRADVDQLVEQRTQARAQKDFKKSDELRDQLTKMGISVSDLATGSFWEVTK